MGWIKIKGMKFYAFHGHFEAERIVGNHFQVDIRLKTDCSKAAVSDNLNDTLNYQEVYLLVKSEMGKTSSLLENVAQRILDLLFEKFPQTKKAKIKVSKLNPPMGGEIEKVSVILSKKL
jgi:7,8-dihydroneopterin aldolase/epimerase/oxygenase